MQVVAAVFADFVQAPAGGPSQLDTPLGSRTILGHTLHRLMQVEGLAARCLFVRPRDRDKATQALRATGLNGAIELLPLDTAPHGRRLLLTAARKWNLESWRGGLVGATWFDEFVDPHAAALVVNHYGCDAVLCLDGHQPVFDPAVASAMIRHLEAHRRENKVVFTQAPPGLAGIVMRPEALQELLNYNVPVGLLFSYRPEFAQSDPITQHACYRLPSEITQTPARLTGDTQRSRELLEAALRELGEEVPAATLCAWLRTSGHQRTGPLPIEVELELTTDDPRPHTTLHPRGQRIPRREVTDLAAIRRLARELAEYDDRLVVLAGHGDPLRHAKFGEICHLLRSAGVYGIAVVTSLLDLDDQSLEALFGSHVDILEVQLDAHSAETYIQVHGIDGFDRAVANVQRVERMRRERQSPQPLLVCSLTRCAATIKEMEQFYDYWIRNAGSALIHGYSSYCGRLPADTLLSTTPWLREPCRRLASRLTLLADGTVALCAQDVEGQVKLGNWIREPLKQIWAGAELVAAREAHGRLALEALPLCAYCDQWNRP